MSRLPSYGILYNKKQHDISIYQKAYYLSQKIREQYLKKKIKEIYERENTISALRYSKERLAKFLERLAFQLLQNHSREELIELYKVFTPNANDQLIDYLRSKEIHILARIVAQRIYLSHIQ